jgi:hypothetical protein
MSIRLVEDTSDSNYVMDLLDITLTPELPRLGHQLRWTMNGHLKESVDLTRVTCNIVMKVGPVKILDRNLRLPDLLAAMGTGLTGNPQPPAGHWKQTWNLQLPRTVPVARHRIRLHARTASGKNFFALNIPVDFNRTYHSTAA